MARTYFHDFCRDDGAPITIEYENGICAHIVDAWPRTEEYDHLWVLKNAIETGAYGKQRHFLSLNEDDRETLDDIEHQIAAAKFDLTDSERERIEDWLSENHIRESDDDVAF